jgi:hypothetical protein
MLPVPMPLERAAVLLVAVSLLAGCRPGAEPRPTAAPPAPGGGACTLAPTGGLLRQTITAPGPSGATATRTYELYVPRGVAPRSSRSTASATSPGRARPTSCGTTGVWAFLTTRSTPAAATCP